MNEQQLQLQYSEREKEALCSLGPVRFKAGTPLDVQLVGTKALMKACGFGLELEIHGKLFYVHWTDTVEDLSNFLLKIES